MAEDCTSTINNTVTQDLEGKHQHKKIPSCTTLKTYGKTPILISVDITEDGVKSVAQKRSESSVPGGTDSEALQGWILKFGEVSKIIHNRLETFVDWLGNGRMSWQAYCDFMSSRLIALDKQPVVRPVVVRETWRRLFANTVLKVTGTEATMACQREHMCAGLK